MKMHLFLAIICLGLMMPVRSHAELPPDAQTAIKKGIMAAKEQEWDIAIQSFQDARKITPNDPKIFYNLGLAESKVPGHELRAIAWFGAYLAAMPNAPNAAAINDFIAALQIKNQGNLNRLIKTTQDTANQMTDSSSILQSVAALKAESGDVEASLKTVEKIPDDWGKVLAETNISSIQAKAGDLAGAKETMELALKILNSMQNHSVDQVIFIAKAQISNGDMAAAKETIASALETANSIQDLNAKFTALISIIGAQASLGDIAAAKETLASVLNVFNSMEDGQLKNLSEQNFSVVYSNIADAQLKNGDIAGAKGSLGSMIKYADMIQDKDNKYMSQFAISTIQSKITQTQAAKNVQPLDHPVDSLQSSVQGVKISDWLDKLDDNFTSHDCALNTDQFLDLAGYLTAQHSDNPQILFSMLDDTAEKIIKAQNIIYQMLKQQAKEQSKP